MYPTRVTSLLVVALSVLSVANATFIDANVVGRNGHEIMKRQRGGGTGSSVTAEATSEPPSTTTPDTSSTPEPTSPSETPTVTDVTSSKPSSTPTPTPTSSKPSSSSSTPPPKTTSTTPTKTKSTSSSSSSSVPISTITQIVTHTNADGSRSTYTTQSTSTPTAGLQNGSSKSTSSGMSKSTRNIVIGVVVGVGGAIVLGGIALVAWRIWGRKKSQTENDALMDYNGGYSTVEKPEPTGSPSGRTPFQSTLESYHAPTQVNTASNF